MPQENAEAAVQNGGEQKPTKQASASSPAKADGEVTAERTGAQKATPSDEAAEEDEQVAAQQELRQPSKRQKISESQDKVKPAAQENGEDEEEEKKEGGNVVADDSEDFEDGQPGGENEDSFDDDFDAVDDEDELPPGEGEDDFDMEAYLKWRAENPDEGVQPPGGDKNDPGAELPEDEDDEGDDYDDEDD